MNLFEKERGAKRAVNMLIAKINGKPFTTEYPMPDFDRVAPNPAVKDIAHAKIALVTSGGIVPRAIRIISRAPTLPITASTTSKA